MTFYRGLFPPLITVFDERQQLNERAMREHIDFMINGSVDGLCTGSSTGEFSTLSRVEWERVVEITVDQVDGRVPVFAGGGWMSTGEAIDRCRFAQKTGCQGLLVISPWYQLHTQREIYAHFKAIHESVDLPIMIYNNPPVVGVEVSVELLVQFAEEGIVQYMKETNPDPYNLSRLKMKVGDKLQLFYGHDNNALGAFACGATGWVSGTANFDPARWSRFVHACIDDEDFVKGREIWYEMLPFVEMATVGKGGERADWVAIIKKGLELRGRKVGPVRLPMLPLNEQDERILTAIVDQMSFEDS